MDPSDWRVSEIRLLELVSTENITTPENRPDGLPEPTSDNLLITGDAMHTLRALAELPDYADKYLGKIKLCYIDPPFGTGKAFANYEDNIDHSIWLTMMRDRLQQIKPLLAQDSVVWVHLDDNEVHRCRVVMDEVFGVENFVAQVLWQKADNTRSNNLGFTITTHSWSIGNQTSGCRTEWRAQQLWISSTRRPTEILNDGSTVRLQSVATRSITITYTRFNTGDRVN